MRFNTRDLGPAINKSDPKPCIKWPGAHYNPFDEILTPVT